MSVAPVKQKNTVYYINTCITVILFLGIGHLPPFGQITPMGMKVLAVFIGMLCLAEYFRYNYVGFIRSDDRQSGILLRLG